MPSIDALGTEDPATQCDTTHNTVSDTMCAPSSTVIGYMGGNGSYPRYDTNYTELGYSETVRLVYDPAKLSMEEIMATYFKFCPDPTYPESDPAYKNRIFTTTKAQQLVANASLANATLAANATLYVNIQDADKYEFWKAEEYNQQYNFKAGETCSSPLRTIPRGKRV